MNHISKSIVFLSAILFVCAITALAQQADSIKKISPADGARSRKIDVKHIDIDLRFDWKKKQAYGITTIMLTPIGSTNQITLDAGMLSIHSITLVNGKSLKFEYDGSDKYDALKVMLDRIYQPNEDIILKIDYGTNHVNETDPNNLWGSYGKGIRFFEPSFTDTRKRKQIWTNGIPEGNRYWFPCYDDPGDLRTTAFIATVDKKLSVISNGTLVKIRENTDGTHTFHWRTDIPYANHQTSFVVGEYVDIKQNYNGIEIHNFSYPDEVEAVKASTERLTDMIKFFSEKTKIPYPFPVYSQIFVQEFPWGGGHNMMASTLSENMIDDYGTHADFLYLWDGVEANDLAAQWFGNMLTPKSWEHSWLSRSFAAYFSELYSEYKNGFDEFQLYNRTMLDLSAINADWSAGVRRPIVTRKFDDANIMIGDNYALSRGPQVLHMLRKYIGEENWWKAIHLYLKTNAYKLVETSNFQKAVEQATGENMEWFFDQWVYKMGFPLFEVSKKYDATNKRLTLIIKQTQTLDSANVYPQVQYFKGKMDIAIDDQIKQVWLEPRRENVFTFKAIALPKLINVDYGSTWIKEMKFEKSLDEWLYQFQNDKDILGRNTAMYELVKVAKNESTTTIDKERIISTFHKVISGTVYWRFRQTALNQLRGILKAPYNGKTLAIVKSLTGKGNSWLRSSAIFFLGTTNDKKYTPLYISYLNDQSDRVIAAAATALAKTKSPEAFDILNKLKDKPSWKNQSLMSALSAMQVLGDPRAVEIALHALKDKPAKPRWTLANNSWDYRVVAAETLTAFGKGNEGFPVVLERFKKSMEENDVNDIFNNVMLTAILADPRGQEVFDLTKAKFKDDANAMIAVNQYEAQFKEKTKKP